MTCSAVEAYIACYYAGPILLNQVSPKIMVAGG
jgi:hypothetical protein